MVTISSAVATNFAAAPYAPKKETFNELMALCSEVTS